MQTVSLSWQHCGQVAVVLTAAGGALALTKDPRLRAVGAFLREAAIIGVLYGLWQLAGELSGLSVTGAFDRARWIYHFERDIWLPSESSVQHLVLGHTFLLQVMNLYYATMHFTMMFVFLIWLFVRHRDRYRPIRQVLAWTTLCCLLIQLIPVAPPRLLSGIGIVDTAKVLNQSVYANGWVFDQLSAMPSVHVGWAVLVGYYTWRVSPSRWRYIGAAHAVMTIFVVVATGNHWWSDGIVASLVLVICAWSVFGVRTGWHAALTRWRAARSAQPAPAAASVS